MAAATPSPKVLSFSRQCTGDLRQTPFAELLMELHAARATGSLEIETSADGTGEAVYFDHGQPIAALATGGAERVRDVLVPLCARAHGRFVFHPMQNRLGGGQLLVHGDTDPLAVIAAALRGPARRDAIERALIAIGGDRFRLRAHLEIERYRFTAAEQSVVEALGEGWTTAQDLRICSPLHESQTDRLLYVLCVTRALSLPSSTQRDTLSGTVRRRDPVDRLGETPLPSLRGVSGAMAAATPAVSRAAATMLEHGPAPTAARRAPEPAPAREEAPAPRQAAPQRDVAAQSPAKSLFGHWVPGRPRCLPGESAGQSGRYSLQGAELAPPDPAGAQPVVGSERVEDDGRAADTTRAQRHHDKATALIARQSFDRALNEIRAALAADADRADSEALHGFLLWELRARIPDAELQAKLHLGRALRLDPHCARAHYYQGLVLKGQGELERAHEHFARAAALDPRDLAAQREVRVYRMRSRRDRPPKPSGLVRLIAASKKPENER